MKGDEMRSLPEPKDLMVTITRDVASRRERIGQIVTWCKAITIVDDDTNIRAAAYLTAVKEIQKRIDEHHDPGIRKKYQDHQAAIEDKKLDREPLDEARRILEARRIAWDKEQKRLAQVEADRLQAEADRKIEEEKEATRKIAQEIREIGGEEQAEILEHYAETQQSPQILVNTRPTPRIRGQAPRPVYSAEVDNMDLVVEAWLAGRVPKELLIVNDVFLGKQVRDPLTRPKVEGWAGIKVNEGTTLA